MPDSEPKPKLIELVGPGAGQGWKAVLRNGKAAVVHEIPVPPAEATAAVPRLQRLYEHRHPALSPVLAWGTDQNGVWVAVEPNEGTPLGSILSRGPLTPPAARLPPVGQRATQPELATRAAGREVPPITPFLPEGTVAPKPTAPTPAPYIAPARREETPARSPASYDAPDRPLQTYPAMPAITFPPAPAPTPAPPPPAPAAPASPAPPVPTRSDPPSRTSAPVEPEASARTTDPPAPPTWTPYEPSKPVEAEPAKPAEPEVAKPAPSFESVAPASPFVTYPPAAPAPAEAPAPSPPPAQQTWTPVEAPVWKPGETVPAEPLGTGVAVVESPPKAPTPAPIPRAPIAAPARRPSVARPPSRRRPLSERPPWLLPAAVAVAIVILLGIFGVIVLANRGGGQVTGGVHTTPTAHASTSPAASPSPSATTKGPLAVPNFGPTSADPISKVQICTTASPCNIPGGSPENGTACDLSS